MSDTNIQSPLSWDNYFMGIAILASMRSKDPNTKVGACVVNSEHKIVSCGYNGMPRGCSDNKMPWERNGDFLNTKYPFVCHAELNAVLNNVTDLKGCDIYVTLFPCNECAKVIIQAGIKRVIYMSDKYADTESTIASKMLFKQCGVAFEQYKPLNKDLTISI